MNEPYNDESVDVIERDDDFDDLYAERDRRHREILIFIRGAVLGFGLAAAATAIFGIFQDQRERRKNAFSAETRIRRQDESGGVIGDLSYIVDESTSAFKDAVKTLDKTFESGRAAIEIIQDVIDRIRE